MRVIEGDGVNNLYYLGVNLVQTFGEPEQSRNGTVLVMPCPVTSVYRSPQKRVLLDKNRNANPFFHLYESLWMLAGRDDVASLNNFIRDFGDRFAEPNGAVHGAYGHRWRRAFGFDQLNAIVKKLRNDRTSRQAVLTMWDPGPNCVDLDGDWKDRPCNTHIYFRIRDDGLRHYSSLSGVRQLDHVYDRRQVLDMTICCRSNDLIYGAYGANAVHFSMLMEYMAGRVGVAVGRMYQISNNFHIYHSTMPKEPVNTFEEIDYPGWMTIGSDWDRWDNDLMLFMEWHKRLLEIGDALEIRYNNAWFSDVAERMMLSHELWKSGMKTSARLMAHKIAAPDWQCAALNWFDARSKK